MAGGRVVVIGAGVGGLSVALELKRHGFDVLVLERNGGIGGKASERTEAGFRWDEGPSILVMPWVYQTLFRASGLDPDAYLRFKRLDPAFRVVLSDGQRLDIPADPEGLRQAFAAIDPQAGDQLPKFLERLDRFAKLIGHAYCDRQFDRWGQVMFSPLMLSAAVISPSQKYAAMIDSYFRSPAIRELLYGFPTYSGFDPNTAPASLALIPWTIIREGVWYPEEGGIAAIPRAIARACRDRGIEIRTNTAVDAIELDGENRVRGVATSSGFEPADAVVSNGDYLNTFRWLTGGRGFTPDHERLRAGDAEPASSFYSIQVGCDRNFDLFAHHLLLLTPGSSRVYDELFGQGRYPADPPIYANVTSITDPADAPAGGCNPFLVIGAPPLPPGGTHDPGEESRHADGLLATLERAGATGLKASVVTRLDTGPSQWRTKFDLFRGSIYGLGNQHNILGGSFRPRNDCPEIPGLYFAGGGVQPGPGLPMVVQSGKITATLVAQQVRRRKVSVATR